LDIGIATLACSSTEFFPDIDIYHGLELIRQCGFTHVEYNDQSFPSFCDADEAELTRIGDHARSLGLTLWSSHSPCARGDIFDEDAAKRRAAIDLNIRCLDGLAAAGVARIVVHQAETGLDDNTRVPPQSVDAVGELCETGGERGVRILVENFGRFPTRLCVDLCRQVDSEHLGIVIDTGHAHHTPLDVADEIRVAGPFLESLHVHDNAGPEAGDQHLPPGFGTIEWPKVLSALGDVGYAGPFMMEIIPFHPPIKDRPAEEVARVSFDAATRVLGMQDRRTL